MNEGVRTRRPRVGFLFNHDKAQQVAHIAGIARELAAGFPDVEVLALHSRKSLRSTAQALIGPKASANIQWVNIAPRGLLRGIAAKADRLLPFSRLAALRQNLPVFASLEAVVTTERTCLALKPMLGESAPRFIYVPHGAGDRNVAYHPAKAEFDLFLVSGPKYVEAAQAAGILGESNWRIIGYPKFDVMLGERSRPKLFDNDRPVFLYNPHFDPKLSSFYDFGLDLIEHFYANPGRYNLVVAPHVMLFRKKIHYSLELHKLRLRPEIPPRYHGTPNILIDTGSERLLNMHYTLGADAYIGDVSSQVYEFLAIPRPCFFLDSHGGRERMTSENYRFWHLGPVTGSVEELTAMLPNWRGIGEAYREEQVRQFAYSIDLGAEPASLRGARAVADYVRDLA